MKLKTLLTIALGVFLVLSCHTPSLGPAGPTSLPTPSPSPSVYTVPTAGPLHIDAHRFRDHSGQKVYLLGAITCCTGNGGWPLVSTEVLDAIAAHRGNYTHIRIGPNSLTSPDSAHTGYARVGGKLDLDQWDSAYFARVRAVIEAARQRGIYVEISLIDCWLFKHDFSAWSAAANRQGFEGGSCEVVGRAPHKRAEEWLRKVVDEFGVYDNVLWQDGNEVFDCGQDPVEWTRGIHAIVRDEEARMGFPSHPFGTNAQVPGLVFSLSNGYEIRHEDAPSASGGRPLVFNEYAGVSGDEYCQLVGEGAREESSFMLWRGGMSKTQWEQALGCLEKVKEGLGF